MFFRDKVHLSEIIKWGIIAGLAEGAYIGIATVLFAKQQDLLSLSGWEQGTTYLLLFVVAITGLLSTIIVFAHPLYSLLKGAKTDALYTVLVTLLTILAVAAFTCFAYKQLVI